MELPRLHVSLDAPLPAELAVGLGTAVFVCGRCSAGTQRIRSLRLLVDGTPQDPVAWGMPRLDPFEDLEPPSPGDYASGFWGLARVPAEAAARSSCTIGLRAELSPGTRAEAVLGVIPIRPIPTREAPTRPGGIRASHSPAPSRADLEQPLVAVCMATHNPPEDLLIRQLESIRAQTHHRWVCVISDDHSRAESFAALQAAVGDDPRIHVDRSPSRLGFYRNFERALALAPAEAQFVALADQDDRWYPHKLSELVAQIGEAPLVYSDARVVDRSGAVLSDTYWRQRDNNHSDLLSLAVANCVTGAASLLSADLLRLALPFPPAQFAHYHDHWLALTAAAVGQIAYVEEPLYDYVQHGRAALGHATANQMPRLGDRLSSLRRRPLRERVRKWRMHYFVDLMRLAQCAAILELRCGGLLSPEKLRTIRRLQNAERSPELLARLAVRGARELVGRPQTLGAEWMLVGALLWRRALQLSARGRPQRRLRLDALPPTDLAPGPAPLAAPAVSAAARLSAKIAPLDLAVDADAPPRVNLLVPAIDLDHFFGGYIAKFNLARALAERGHRVRVVAVDPVPPLPPGWRRGLERAAGLEAGLREVEIDFARSRPLPVSPRDRFIATTWWTAHIAADAVTVLGRPDFLYLIQEYEPFTFPMGSYAAMADASYRLPHTALFSSELLRDFFRLRRLGVFAPGPRAGERRSRSFQNALTAMPAAEVGAMRGRPRRLLFYGRPEPHAARNMFEVGLLALELAAERGELDGWELTGVGAQAAAELPVAGLRLRMTPRLDPAAYAQLLSGHDVGLALMYTPHPSLVPLEMAAAGMLTVTNRFENKTPEALAAISPNLMAAEPTPAAVADALCEAVAASGDLQRRVAGSRVAWARSWSEAFPPDLLGEVEAMLQTDASAPRLGD